MHKIFDDVAKMSSDVDKRMINLSVWWVSKNDVSSRIFLWFDWSNPPKCLSWPRLNGKMGYNNT